MARRAAIIRSFSLQAAALLAVTLAPTTVASGEASVEVKEVGCHTVAATPKVPAENIDPLVSDDYKIVSHDKEVKLVVAAVFCDEVIIEEPEKPISLKDVTWATMSVDLELLEERRGDYRFWLASNNAEFIDFLKGWYGTKAVHVKD